MADLLRKTPAPKEPQGRKKKKATESTPRSPPRTPQDDYQNYFDSPSEFGLSPKLENEENKTHDLLKSILIGLEQLSTVCSESREFGKKAVPILDYLAYSIKELIRKQQSDEQLREQQFKSLSDEIKELKASIQDLKQGHSTSRRSTTCLFCQQSTHQTAKCRYYKTGYSRRQRLNNLGVCFRCYGSKEHVKCPKEGQKCEVCGTIAGKMDTDHHEDCCDVRFPHAAPLMEMEIFPRSNEERASCRSSSKRPRRN